MSQSLGLSLEKELVLVRRAQGGDERAFVELVKSYQNLVVSVCLSILGERTMSEDAAQETFVRAWKGVRQLKEERKFRPWLMAIARRSALRMLPRRKGLNQEELREEKDAGLSPDEVVAKSDDLELVMASLSSLPEKYRLPMILFYREGESVAAVAKLLDLRPDAVKQRLKRGRDLLREKVESRMARALRMSAPGTAFTAGVATVVSQLGGAGTAAAAGATGAAGEVFVTSGAGVGSSSVVTGTTMMTSKFSTITAVAVMLVAVPVGYGMKEVVARSGSKTAPRVATSNEADSLLEEIRSRSLPPSQVVDEWKRLVEVHGKTAPGMAAIFDEVKKREEGFVKKALLTTLVAEWVRVDAPGGFETMKKQGSWSNRYFFLEEWVKADPTAAMERAVAWAEEDLDGRFPGDVGLMLAERSPELFIDSLGVLPFDQIGTRGSAHEGLDLVASRRPLELRDAALLFEGDRRRILMNAALKGWAEVNPKAALNWLKSNPEEDKIVQSEQFFAVAEGWTQEQPQEFLAELKEMTQNPPGNWSSEALYARLATLALASIAEEDLAGAFRWWGENRKELAEDSVDHRMRSRVHLELTRNPEEMVRLFEENGLWEEARKMIGMGGNEGDITAKWQEVATAIKGIEPNRGRDQLVAAVALALQQRSPEDAVAFVEKADGERTDSAARFLLVSEFVGRDPAISEIENLITQYPKWATDFQEKAVRTLPYPSERKGKSFDFTAWLPMVEGALSNKQPDEFNDFQPLMLKVGTPYLAGDPEAAVDWMFGVMDGKMDDDIRDNFIGQAMGEWLALNSEEALGWIEQKGLQSFSSGVRDGLASQAANSEETLPLFWEVFAMAEFDRSQPYLIKRVIEDFGAEEARRGLQGIELTPAEQTRIEVLLKRNEKGQ